MKTKHLSEAAKFLIIAATILIVCALVVVAFVVMKEGKVGTNKSMSQYNALTNQVNDMDREKYNGLVISGEEVRELIADTLKDTDKDIIIEYKTLKSVTVFDVKDSTLEAKKDADNYINPTGLFMGKAEKNENGVLTKLIFTQKKK